jgi:thiamine biosynthesis protein ThiS
MFVNINGERKSIPPGQTVLAYLESNHINPNIVACELNLKILRRAHLGSAELKDNDTLEIIRMIGGG